MSASKQNGSSYFPCLHLKLIYLLPFSTGEEMTPYSNTDSPLLQSLPGSVELPTKRQSAAKHALACSVVVHMVLGIKIGWTSRTGHIPSRSLHSSTRKPALPHHGCCVAWWSTVSCDVNLGNTCESSKEKELPLSRSCSSPAGGFPQRLPSGSGKWCSVPCASVSSSAK